MKVPRLPSRRRQDGWLLRISAWLARSDLDRLGADQDAVRTALAERVAQAARPGDERRVLARNQYLMVIRVGRRKTDSRNPVPVVRRLLENLAQPVPSPVGPIFPRLNAAFTTVACDPSDAAAREALAAGLARAEKAGSGVAIAVDPVAGTSQLVTLDTAGTEVVSVLKRAIDAGQVRMHYQPVVRLSDGRITAFEALMRVVDENGDGFLSPAHFIGEAERTGLIHELGRIALTSAAAQMTLWRESLGARAPERIAVNVAAPQLADAGFVAEAEAAFAGVGLDVLTLELTESAMIRELPQARVSLERLREAGAWIALDDFGVEYSNLSYLRDLAVDLVKIDRSFLDGGERGTRGEIILAKIVELAHLLEARVVAEGVADGVQARTLAALGVDYGQGEHFGLPVDGATAEKGLRAKRALPDG